ncbi:SurA N-terminal domain-containing protein [Pseudoduganella sp. GCM10020061]|uniref:SurA N-terminal domain-containing protein n=1 Tax=Pseudoduganella sp. GCM10020061 TaxID=3317345 RepID=UPI00362FD15A
MFETVRTHRKFMMGLLLVLIIPSFVLVGLNTYDSGSSADTIATVGDRKVSQIEFEEAQRSQIDRYREALGAQFDPKMVDTPEEKQRVLDGLITQRALDVEIDKNHMSVDDATLAAFYGKTLVGADGKFDVNQYKSVAAQQGLTTAGLDQMVRRQLALEQVTSSIESTGFAPRTVANRLSDIREQEREAQELLFPAAQYASQVKVTDAMVKAFYDKNAAMFQVPEQATIEYVVFDSAAVAPQVSVTDAEIAAYYNQNKKRYATEEQRRASHILINASREAPAAEKTAARAKAAALLEQLRKNPADFARLARENSQDPGSAEVGGDLGVTEKGAFVKPVEDAIYALKQGEISNLVESEYGYHIITVTEIKPATVRPLEEVKGEIETELRNQKSGRKYSELAEAFTNTVYEQSDSLKPAAEKLGVQVQTASNVSRTPSQAGGTAPYNNAKFLQALFSEDTIKNKRNTEAIEVAPSTLVSGRIVEYKPATVRPLAEVAPAIRERVLQEEAMRLAKAAGEAKLAGVKASGDATGFGEPKLVTRTQQPPFNQVGAIAVLKADVSKLPAYVGVEVPGQGYAVYRINKVQQSAPDVERRKAEAQQISNVVAQQETYSYLEALKKKANVKIKRPVTAPATAPAAAQ